MNSPTAGPNAAPGMGGAHELGLAVGEACMLVLELWPEGQASDGHTQWVVCWGALLDENCLVPSLFALSAWLQLPGSIFVCFLSCWAQSLHFGHSSRWAPSSHCPSVLLQTLYSPSVSLQPVGINFKYNNDKKERKKK